MSATIRVINSENAENIPIEAMLKSKTPMHGVYFLCVEKSEKPLHVLEIFEGAQLVKKINTRKDYKIVGVASDRKEAFELVRQIIERFVKTNSDFVNLKDYMQALPEKL